MANGARVLVDTSVWSLALRRKEGSVSQAEAAIVDVLAQLIAGRRAVLIGAVRQELLTGIGNHATYERLRGALSAIEAVGNEIADYDKAAEFANSCRRVGLATTPVDMLLCSTSARLNLPLLTTDADFSRYSKHLPFRLFAEDAVGGGRPA